MLFEEGKTLAHIQHPNVVQVLNFFAPTKPGHMVMEYERGRTSQREIQLHGSVREDIIRHVFHHMLNGLREVHLHKLLHLDIKPANIYIRRDSFAGSAGFWFRRQTLDGE